MESRMFKIDSELAFEFMVKVAENELEEMVGKNGIEEVVLDVCYNGKYNDGYKIDDLFSMTTGYNSKNEKEANIIYLILNTPLIYKDAGYDFKDDIYWFLNMEYGFDLYNWGIKYGYCFEESVILFSIAHELGHMKHFNEDYNEYGYYKAYEDDQETIYKLNFIFDEEENFITYRRMIRETHADKYGIQFLKKYGGFIKKLVNKGLLIKCTTEEANSIVNEY